MNNLELLNAYKSIVPKYIKNKEIQHYRFFTCCEDINREIMKGRIKHEKYVSNNIYRL